MDPGHKARDDNGEFRVTVEMPSRSERRQGNGWLAPVAAETLPDDPLDKATAWVAQDWLPYLARSAAFGTSGAATRVAADAGDSPPMSAAFPAAFTKSGAIPGGRRPAYDAAAPLTEGRSMEAFQVVRVGCSRAASRTRGNGAPRRSQGETPGAQ